MKRLLVTPLAIVVGLALIPSVASAKGPSEASLAGPGLSGPVSLPGSEASGTLGKVVDGVGFFPAAFRQTPDPMLSKSPGGSLGPKYVITYAVPGPNNEHDVLRQDVYPYASPQPVSYMAPGQTFFGTESTRGGWFVASPELKGTLVDAGLPAQPPTAGGGSSFPWPVVATAAALLAALLAVGFGARVRRRERSPATP